MKQATAIIVDDEPLAIRLLRRHLAQLPELELRGTFTSPVETLAFLRLEAIDLVFLDIQMPTLTGFDFISAAARSPAIILTTAYRDYAADSFDLDIVDYLVKPITFPRFHRAVNRFLERRQAPEVILSKNTGDTEEFRDFNVSRRFVRVRLSDILFIESLKDYVRIHTTTDRHITKEAISELEESLPVYFQRCHRSFIVNMRKLTAYTARDIELGENTIPIGASYRREVMQRLE